LPLFILIIGTSHWATAQVAVIPFEIQGKNIFIKVSINQKDSLLLVFDTGATGTLVDSLSAERAGVEKAGRKDVDAIGSGGSKKYIMALNQTVHLPGNITLDSIDLVLMNFSSLKTISGTQIDGLIGYDLLNKYTTKIDFDNHKLFLYKNMKNVDTIGYTGIPFEFSKGINIARFPISIQSENGEIFTGKVMFDSGAATTLLISAPFRNFHNLKNKLGPAVSANGRGLNATTIGEAATIKSMKFNGFKLGKMVVSSTIDDNAPPKDGYLGIIGMEIIKRFNVIIDYTNKKIYLKPNSYFDTPFVDTLKSKS